MTIAERIAQFTATTYVLTVPAPAEYTRTMETASNYDTYEIAPGRYPVRLTNLNGTTWNPDPNVPTPGFIANTGPYYAKVTVNATHTHKHIVNRLFTASSSEDTYPNEQATITLSTYAYTVHDGAAGPVRGSTFQEQGE